MTRAGFSVVIPVWNDAQWLPGAIDSVLAQTHPDWELVVGDNASDQDLAAIVAGYADPRIRYWRWPGHVGILENQNRTTLLGEQDWIQLLCADDRLHPRCLEQMSARMAALGEELEHVAMVLTACRRVYEDGREVGPEYVGLGRFADIADGVHNARCWLHDVGTTDLPPWNFGSVAIRRDVLLQMGGLFRREILWADVEAVIRVATYGDVLYIDEPLLDVTVRTASDTLHRLRQNRQGRQRLTPLAGVVASALRVHEQQRPLASGERSALMASVAESYLRRAMQHRRLEDGRGRTAALADVLRGVRSSPTTVLRPRYAAAAMASVLAPLSVIELARSRVRRTGHV